MVDVGRVELPSSKTYPSQTTRLFNFDLLRTIIKN